MANSLPFNREAEEALVGALLIDPDAMMRVRETDLAQSDFYIERLGMIYAAAIALNTRHEPCDVVTLADELARRKQLETLGGVPYLASLINTTPTSIHVLHYADLVMRCSRRRRLIGAAGEIAALAYQHEGEIGEMYDAASQSLFGAMARGNNGAHLYGGDDALVWYMGEQLRTRMSLEQDQNALLHTYWRDVDDLTGAMQAGQLWIIGANTSVGKTMAMEQLAEANAQRGHTVAYYHFEISHRGMLHRMVARHSGCDSRQLRRGYYGNEVSDAFERIRRWFPNLTLVHCSGWTAERVVADITRLHAQGRCELAVVDYLQKVRLPDKAGYSPYKLIGNAVEALKNCAEEMGIPIVLGSQTNREYKRSGRGRPTAADLRDSGEIEEKANVVLMLHNPIAPESRDAFAPTELIEVYVEKNTDGPTGMVKLVHRKGRFLLGSMVREYEREDIRF